MSGLWDGEEANRTADRHWNCADPWYGDSPRAATTKGQGHQAFWRLIKFAKLWSPTPAPSFTAHPLAPRGACRRLFRQHGGPIQHQPSACKGPQACTAGDPARGSRRQPAHQSNHTASVARSVKASRRGQRLQALGPHRHQEATAEEAIHRSSHPPTGMEHAGPRTGSRRPEQTQSRQKLVLRAERDQPLHAGQEIGLLLLHEHGPAEAFLQAPAAAMAIASEQHDRACAAPRPIGEKVSGGPAVWRAVDEHISSAGLQQPGAAAMGGGVGGEEPQAWARLPGGPTLAGGPGWKHRSGHGPHRRGVGEEPNLAPIASPCR